MPYKSLLTGLERSFDCSQKYFWLSSKVFVTPAKRLSLYFFYPCKANLLSPRGCTFVPLYILKESSIPLGGVSLSKKRYTFFACFPENFPYKSSFSETCWLIAIYRKSWRNFLLSFHNLYSFHCVDEQQCHMPNRSCLDNGKHYHPMLGQTHVSLLRIRSQKPAQIYFIGLFYLIHF